MKYKVNELENRIARFRRKDPKVSGSIVETTVIPTDSLTRIITDISRGKPAKDALNKQPEETVISVDIRHLSGGGNENPI